MSLQGSTPSSSTGPTSAYEGQTYSYIETSSPRTNGDVAILQGPSITTSRTFCLSFAYHMYGSNIDSLFVNLASPNGNQTLFSRNGDAGDSWFVTSISIPASNGEIQFIGVRGSSYRGDIAIDDVHFLDGECSTRFNAVFRHRSVVGLRRRNIFLHRNIVTKNRRRCSHSAGPKYHYK
uniref:MAM domain-containing glycosylphosphatidylinositol anchor protein 1 n=1 Tax=Magallana gigas TaxID=29159 RepID=K1RGU0_MAGGI